MVNEPTGRPGGSAPSEMAQLAKLIMRMGPDIDLIARTSGQYKETIRYRYKEKMIGRGFAIHARLNFEGLGMQRVVMKVALNANYTAYSKELFLAMNKLCYVVSFAPLLPDGTYMLHASVPKQYRKDFVVLMKQLKDLGVFDAVEFYTFDWYRNVQMRSEFFDFDNGVWDFDWTKTVEPAKDDNPGPSEPFAFDKLDLLILKELQMDATRSLSEIRESIKRNNNLDVNYKTLAWHWGRHVQEKRMVNGYVLRWMGTTYDQATGVGKHRQHRYMAISVFVHGVSDEERVALISKMNKIPFIWSEAAGEDYHAQFAIPVVMVNDAFSFLRDAFAGFGPRASYSVMDQANSRSYTLSYELFNDENRSWTFNGPELLTRFENLVLKIKEGSGETRN